MILTVRTKRKKEVVDLTGLIEGEIAARKWDDGFVALYVAHTTCALTTADLDPGTDTDLLYALDHMLPEGEYRHPHDPGHVGDHIMASVIGTSVLLPIHEGKLFTGMWQRAVLIELSGPRKRSILMRLMKTTDT